MAKPRIIIADTDINYIIPLQLKFVEKYFEQIEIEIITDPQYYNALFSTPQTAGVLIVSEELYDIGLQRHDIDNIFLMTEQVEEDQTGDLKVDRIFKYTSIKEIFNKIVGKSVVLNRDVANDKEPQIVLVYSASGGAGKTTLAMGIAACLTKNYKRVLYINAGRLQSFQRLLDNHSAITASDVYAKLTNPGDSAFEDVRHVIRQEQFYYLPPFKAALMSLGLKYSVYEKIALGAKRAYTYDYIIVDADPAFDEEEAKLLSIADKVIMVTKQNSASVYATNVLVSNINGAGSDKYIFVCNDFDKEQDNALISPSMAMRFSVSDYVDHLDHYDQMKPIDFAREISIQRVAFLIN